ncbi:MAG: reverse transcriptase-like protein [Lachnospiraceae bacterium]|nr:reverse transcriptase-like protein [Lachnospiraceae bacterium]
MESSGKKLTAYVDGSFNVNEGRYGFGCVFIEEDGTVTEKLGSNCNEESAKLRNVTGEMLGSMYAVKWAMLNGFSEIRIFYDYTGIELWATGKWKTNNDLTRKYAASMREWSEKIRISFEKVEAHTGVKYNEMADKLAKRAIEEKIPIPDLKEKA